MSVRIKGKQDVVEQPRRRRIVDGLLVSLTRSWKGSKAAIAAFQRDNMNALADGCDIVDFGGYSILSATFAMDVELSPNGEGVISDRWERQRVEVDRDIRLAPYWATQEPNRSTRAEWFAVADRYLNDLDEVGLEDGPSTAVPGWVWQYIEDRQHGIDVYMADYYVLRRRRRLARASKIKAADDGVWHVTSVIPYKAPANQTSISSIPKFRIPAGLEWLKYPTQVNNMGGGIDEVVEEWWGLEKWAGRYYPGGSG